MKNIWLKIKTFFANILRRAYGMDDLNKLYAILYFIFYGLFIFIKIPIIKLLSLVFLVLFMYRYFSKKHFKRSEENRRYRAKTKLIGTKWQFRKTHKIFKCKNCGQFIKVPKGHGKIETTCPKCGNKEIHHS